MDTKDKLLDHDYDGIKELDNPLPRWWLLTFYGAIIFAIGYLSYYHLGPGSTPEQALNEGLKEIESRKQSANPNGGIDAKKLAAYATDKSRLSDGKSIFVARCVVCHGQNGEGNIGPNLTDNFWIHGDGSLAEIAEVVTGGVADKGMPPWGGILKIDELYSVVAYVHSLRGTHPPNPKAPQGKEVKE